MLPSDMTNKVALVTGAAAGLGRETALCLAEAGADVILVDIAEHGLSETADELSRLGRRSLVLPRDLSSRENCANVVEEGIKQFGRLDALCNVAGIMIPGQTVEVTDQAWDATLAINLSAPFFLIRAAIPHLIRSRGAVVNVTSCAAFNGQAYFAAYCASKAGLTHMTKALAMEFMHQPVRINAVAPGGMLTGMTENMRLLRDGDPSLLARIASPRGLCEIVDVARCIAFLASDAARSYHGACINIDAGATVG